MFLQSTMALLRAYASSRERGELHPDTIHSLVLVELTRLGDVISILPSVDLLAKRFNVSTIHLFVEERFALLLRGLDLRAIIHGVRRSQTATGIGAAILSVRAQRPDLALSMSPANRNALLVLASGAQYLAGYLGYAAAFTPIYSSVKLDVYGFPPVMNNDKVMNRIEDRAFRICHHLGIFQKSMGIRFLPDVRESGYLRLKERGIVPDGDYLVVHPFARWGFRAWEESKFVDLIGMLVSKIGCGIVLIGASDETVRLRLIQSKLRHDPHVMTFSPESLIDTAVLISGATLFVGNDSGPLHLAAALGVPVLGLFGPTDPNLTAPLTERGLFIYKKLECSPCDQRQCVRPEDPCLAKISPEEVFGAVARLVEHGRSTSRSVHV